MNTQEIPVPSTAKLPNNLGIGMSANGPGVDTTESDSDSRSDSGATEDDSNMLNMLEAYSAANSTQKGSYLKTEVVQTFYSLIFNLPGKRRELDCESHTSTLDLQVDSDSHALTQLKKIIESPPDIYEEYTRIKKDIFHAFHMLPIPVNHGSRPAFLRALRDHLLRWDPTIRSEVDKVCRKHFDLTFDQMLRRNPRFIAERTPRHVPPPSVLVTAIQHVYDMFKDAIDAKTGSPLFTEPFKIKANSVLELARQGYFSDIDGVPMYEKAGVDVYGLQKWKCVRGTNNVEGGPHGDIYRKFGGLHGKCFLVISDN